MKQTFKNIAIASIAGCLTVTSAWAANQSSTDNAWEAGGRARRIFNPQNMETIQGKVLSVEQPTTRRQGVHLQVQTDSGTVQVALGPQWYINSQEPKIKPNDEVEITGPEATINGQSGLIASKVRTHGQVLQLRDQNGRPAWRQSKNMMGQNSGQSMMGNQGRMSRNGMGKGMMAQGSADGCCGQEMTRGSGKSMMSQGRMMQHRQALMAKLQEAQADLEQKVQKMNQATGQDKIKAMANVINELAQQRQELLDHLEKASQQMMTHMRDHQQQSQGMMGGAESGTGDSGWSSTRSGNDQSGQ